MRWTLLLLATLAVAGSTLAAPASTTENPILNQLQGGSTDGADNTGVFQNGLSGSNGGSLVDSLKQSVNALAPGPEKSSVLSSFFAYGINIPAPAPAVLSQLTALPANQQQSLFSELLVELVSPVSGPAQANANPPANTVGFGTDSGMTSSSGSRKLLRQ